MRSYRFQLLVTATCLVTAVSVGSAQRPTGSSPQTSAAAAAAAAQRAGINPNDPAQVAQALQQSGMTQEQIHARLRQMGYPENSLDAYMPGASPALVPKQTTPDALRAFQALGVDSLVATSDSIRVANMTMARIRDSLMFMDSVARVQRMAMRADIADSLAQVDSGYNIFGLNVFRGSTLRFDPSTVGPVDANYRLGPGDGLVLILTGDVEASYALDVTREGFIVIPTVGQINVANLTLGQLNDVLYSRLGRVYSGVRRGAGATTHFSVSVARLRSNQVFVLGEVSQPGSYMISSAGTAINALYAAGGPTASGSMRNVQIKRGGQVVSSFDLYDYLLHGDASRDMRLENGDIVFVPARGHRVRIIGEVIRPATYEMKPEETLADVVRAAGGFRADASRRRVQIERILPPSQRSQSGVDRVTMDISSAGYQDGTAPPVPLESGDVIRVFSVDTRVRRTVVVLGDVYSPGPQGLSPGMSLGAAIQQAGGPRPDVYLGQVLVNRVQQNGTAIQLRGSLRDSLGNMLQDVPLQENDTIQVFSVNDFRTARYVGIGGAVRKPGRYPYRLGMTMRDLVLMAGGLDEGAFLREAEIARLPDDRSATTTAVTMRVPLDSTYLFDRQGAERYVGPPGVGTNAAGTPEVILKPYDNVLIFRQPSWNLDRLVIVSGEVNFPGRYALTTRTERLSDIIQRAGGLTADAYAEGTVFIRTQGSVGRVAIDTREALRNPGSPENLQLLDGDSIYVPLHSYTVEVSGAVNAPTVVAYVPGAGLGYYISQAGGAAKGADSRHAFVTQPNGKRETKGFLSEPHPLAGASVVVPERNGPARNVVQSTLQTLTPIATSLVALVLLLRKV